MMMIYDENLFKRRTMNDFIYLILPTSGPLSIVPVVIPSCFFSYFDLFVPAVLSLPLFFIVIFLSLILVVVILLLVFIVVVVVLLLVIVFVIPPVDIFSWTPLPC